MFGGTFDPIHIGHLRPALEVLEALRLGEVRLIPAQIPPHRGMPQLSAEWRLRLLQLSVRDCPGLSVDTRELERPGPSYMVDTLASLRAEFPAAPLCLILGMDAFLGLPRWHRWEELTDYAHIVVLDRPGSRLPDSGVLAEWLAGRRAAEPEALHRILAGQVWFQPVTQLDVSATQIRTLLNAGRSAQYLLTEPAWQAVREHKLYGYGLS